MNVQNTPRSAFALALARDRMADAWPTLADLVQRAYADGADLRGMGAFVFSAEIGDRLDLHVADGAAVGLVRLERLAAMVRRVAPAFAATLDAPAPVGCVWLVQLAEGDAVCSPLDVAELTTDPAA